ncbi:MAG TPA: methionine synthase [Mycobacteriales bacterium]|nr:methionine synthase [Mycobacteriales bacterium]
MDLQPSGWRFVPRPSTAGRRADDYLRWDLDAAQEAFAGHAGPVKVQAAGPWTLAATVELHRGDRALSDRGACRDIRDALADGLARHVAEVRRRLPGATVVVQLDEPALTAVVNGRVPTASGFGTVRTPEAPELAEAIAAVRDATGAPTGVHCCAADVPLALLGGAAFVSLDLGLLTTRQYDALGELLDAGTHLLAGTTSPEPVRRLRRALGLRLPVTVTPPCGLAGATPDGARATMREVREVARRLAEEDE